ncbi:helix-turn-helix domain-containing protein [Natrialba sp. INN-245]|uniref:helix-turn-helix domain-containing protein n=1 Tax=Natrialba sp. INN-245 TaxID=2690967 RepID=UPI001311B724|nr:helix-turn-helix domain-containing protein [Natrialba sp. INN-245]MWV39991.1 DNA-binding protein [Natrialba sp. INN-245]
MGEGIRTEIRIDEPDDCPVATASAEAGAVCHHASRSENASGVTEEFLVDAEASEGLEESVSDVDLDEVFTYAINSVYRFDRDAARGCPCEVIEGLEYPIFDIYARNGSLFVSFHVADAEGVREVVSTLRDQYGSVEVENLIRSQQASGDEALAFIDRTELTDRQWEVLRMAYEMGYFDHPKQANASDVAEVLDIAPATLSEHLAAAQTKVFESILDE